MKYNEFSDLCKTQKPVLVNISCGEIEVTFANGLIVTINPSDEDQWRLSFETNLEKEQQRLKAEADKKKKAEDIQKINACLSELSEEKRTEVIDILKSISLERTFFNFTK